MQWGSRGVAPFTRGRRSVVEVAEVLCGLRRAAPASHGRFYRCSWILSLCGL